MKTDLYKPARPALRRARRRIAAVCLLSTAVAVGGAKADERPNVLIVSVDTLRADHLASYGYDGRLTPNIDRLVERGARFTEARTIEPLTAPALASMLTSLDPHRHGASRNGLRLRSGLASMPKALQAHGYRTVALVGNWTLRDKLSGLGEHFSIYEEVLTRARWFGMIRREATADDLTDRAIEWTAEHTRTEGDVPFMLWVHYVDPHAPYRAHPELATKIGMERRSSYTPAERYRMEIAYTDRAIGRLLRGIEAHSPLADTLVVFVSDHGESLGEHDYWGHGRNLYEPTLRIPMAIVWPGRIPASTVDAPALITDIAPSVLSLLGHPAPDGFEGYDWTQVFRGAPAPAGRVTHYQAHKGSVISKHDSDLARRSGLLEVGVIDGDRKEVFRIGKNRREVFDLRADPLELASTVEQREEPTETLLGWMREVYDGLSSFEDMPPEPLDEESIERMRSLGYVGD
jgi:arylsulfatase A-like enzyme